MPTLTLLRHAKAVEATIGGDDHARPLRDRGRRAAAAVGRQTAAAVPDLVLCSTSARTRETFAHLAAQWPEAPEPMLERGLYLAPPSVLLARLQVLPTTVRSVWLIGHNPGLHELARGLAHNSRDAAPALAEGFPTAARIVFQFEGPWSEIAKAPLRLVEFVVQSKD